ncbi:hypothetical protein [Nonlabens ponticola]|uniref:OmpH family outer membrane protein n=1 Tax=Nonlabens ponticola TaxID=2496866 RepID=A0A3S9MYM2_9FLAO|nr:hypothetical protein [Nonlabens ponticola]AZQ44249.1 hypothetical protein EJ995_08370 [Nonlabens ponticola]
MKKILMIIAFMGSLSLGAQEYIAPSADDDVSKMAKEMAFDFDKKLSLTEKQLLMVEKLNEEFLQRQGLIFDNEELTIAEKNYRMKEMYEEQSREMADILTRPQLARYRKIRGEIQPLVIIEEED